MARTRGWEEWATRRGGGGGRRRCEHKEDRIISVRVLLAEVPFRGGPSRILVPSLRSLCLSLYPLSFPSLVADLFAAESVRCSYAEEGHAACEGAGEHEKRSAAAATAAARKLHRAARRDSGGDRSGSGRAALSQRTHRRDEREALAIAEETSGSDDGRGCRGVLAGPRRLRRHRHQVRFMALPHRCHHHRRSVIADKADTADRPGVRSLSRQRDFDRRVTGDLAVTRTGLSPYCHPTRFVESPSCGGRCTDEELRGERRRSRIDSRIVAEGAHDIAPRPFENRGTRSGNRDVRREY